jgi:protein SCO1
MRCAFLAAGFFLGPLAFGASTVPISYDVADSAHHHDQPRGTVIARMDYKIPQLQLVRQDGKTVSLPDELDDGRPVVLNFIYTTCETSCPLSSATFALFQKQLGAERGRVHLVSISIDPEQDTPERLRAYAKKFGAGPEWQHYTGTLQASVSAQQSFGVYYGDKMSHTPVTLLRAAPGKPWTRIDGFVTPEQLMHLYHESLAAP